MALNALETKFEEYIDNKYRSPINEKAYFMPKNCEQIYDNLDLAISELKQGQTQEELKLLKIDIEYILHTHKSSNCEGLINLTKELLDLVSGMIENPNTSSRKSRHRKARKDRKSRKARKTRKMRK